LGVECGAVIMGRGFLMSFEVAVVVLLTLNLLGVIVLLLFLKEVDRITGVQYADIVKLIIERTEK
jgi:hypothetical protein